METQSTQTQPATNNPQASGQSTEASVMSGAPGGDFSSELKSVQSSKSTAQGQPALADPKTSAVPKETSAPSTQPKEIYLGGRKFSSVEELAQYTSSLESKAQLADRVTSVFNPQQQSQALDPDSELADMIYIDPKKAIAQIKNDSVNQALKVFQQQAESKQLRQSFFDQYQDLKGHEDLVDMYFTRMQKDLANKSTSDATSDLATAVRARIANIRGKVEATEELSSRRPVVAGQSSGAPTAPAAQPAQGSMADQLIAMQNKRRAK